MYLHRVYSPELFADASGRKSTRKPFLHANELMDLIDHEFVRNTASPSFAFPSCPLHMGISLTLGKRLGGMFWSHMGTKIPSQNSAQTPTLCTCEHERK